MKKARGELTGAAKYPDRREIMLTGAGSLAQLQSSKNVEYDPQEDDAKLKVLIDAADQEADTELADHRYRNEMGYCHIFWETKKRILLKKYGIRWKSPADMNPDTFFD